jgi:hypothetical protein
MFGSADTFILITGLRDRADILASNACRLSSNVLVVSPRNNENEVFR